MGNFWQVLRGMLAMAFLIAATFMLVDNRIQDPKDMAQCIIGFLLGIECTRQGWKRRGRKKINKRPYIQENKTDTDVYRIEQVLKKEGGPLSLREIFLLLEDTEHPIGGGFPLRNLSAKLSNSRKFRRVERGVYALTEWEDK